MPLHLGTKPAAGLPAPTPTAAGDELIASGSGGSGLAGVGAHEGRFGERDVARLEIKMGLIPPGTVKGLQLLLDLTPGINLVEPVTTAPGRVVVIKVRKGIPQLVLLAGVIAAFFVGAILLLVTSWALFREPPSASLFDIDPKLLLAIGAGVVALVVIGGRR